MYSFTFKPTESDIISVKQTLGFLWESHPFKPKFSEQNGNITVQLKDVIEVSVFFKVFGMVEQTNAKSQYIDLSRTILKKP